MRPLPQFSIAHLLGLTLLVALDVWGFTRGVWTGFCITLFSQILFWTVMRVIAALRLQPAMKIENRTLRLVKLVFVSALCSLAAAFSFLLTLCAASTIPVAFTDLTGVRFNPSNVLPIVFFGVGIPFGIFTAAAWLWWTWPRK